MTKLRKSSLVGTIAVVICALGPLGSGAASTVARSELRSACPHLTVAPDNCTMPVISSLSMTNRALLVSTVDSRRILGKSFVPRAAVDGGADATVSAAMQFDEFAGSQPDPSAFDAYVEELPIDTSDLVTAMRTRTVFKYNLSESAQVTFTIERKITSRRGGRICNRRFKRRGAARPCRIFAQRAGAFSVAATAGGNTEVFTGKLGRERLKPGSYRATLVATNAAGVSSRAAAAHFKVVSE